MEDMINVLDYGYVRYVDHMGNDTAVVNAARVSYDKEVIEVSDSDVGLIKFLLREGHTSPFRHSAVQLEVYAPMMVARQWWKYHVSSAHLEGQNGWNESSRRYITEEPVFYVPDASGWRTKPANSKQGSGPSLNIADGLPLTSRVVRHFSNCLDLYDELLDIGIAPEQARIVLPAYSLYVRWRWTISLQGLLHFLDQRLAHDAQTEITEYAKAVHGLVEPLFPVVFEAYELEAN